MIKKFVTSFILLSSCLLYTSAGISEDAVSSGVTLISPVSGQTVEPGESVVVELQADESIDANLMVVMLNTIGIAPPTLKQVTGPPFQTSVNIPMAASGPLAFVATLHNSTTEDYFGGARVTVNVIPTDTPSEIVLSDRLFILNPPDMDGNFARSEGNRTLFLQGLYAGGVVRDISLPMTGTMYTSSDANVVQVTSEGVLEPVAPGRAYITIEHKGLKAFAEVMVEDPAQEYLPPIDVTNRLTIERSGFRRDFTTGLFRQTVKLTNVSEFPISGINLVLVNLTDGVKLTNALAATENILPLGSPYIYVSLPMGDPFLDPGESKTLELEFANPQGKSIDYGTMIVEGSEP